MAEQTLKEKTAKGLFWGGISNGVQQLLGVVIGIVLLKNLTPDDYGMFGMLAIFTAIASTIQESGFTAALTNRPEFKSEDYTSVFWFNFFVGSLIYVILFFCAPLIANFYRQPELVLLSRILFLSILVSSLGIAHNAVFFRKLMVKQRAIIDITSTSISGVVGVYMALNGYGYWALAIQTLVYASAGTLFRWMFSPWRPNLKIDFAPVKEMFGFSFKMLFSSIISQIQGNIFSVLLGRFYTKVDVGYFSQGTKWAGMGSSVTNGMLTSVLQPLFVQLQNEKERQLHIFRRILRFVSLVSFPVLLGLAFVSHDFILLIEEKWLPCVPILQMYCVWGAFAPIFILYTQIVVVYGRSDFYFWSNLLFAILQIGGSFLILPYGLYWLAFMNVFLYFVFLFWWHIFVAKLIFIKLTNVLKDIFPYIAIVLLIFFITYMITINIDNLWLSLVLKIVISFFLYINIMYFSNSVVFKDLIVYLKFKNRI